MDAILCILLSSVITAFMYDGAAGLRDWDQIFAMSRALFTQSVGSTPHNPACQSPWPKACASLSPAWHIQMGIVSAEESGSVWGRMEGEVWKNTATFHTFSSVFFFFFLNLPLTQIGECGWFILNNITWIRCEVGLKFLENALMIQPKSLLFFFSKV